MTKHTRNVALVWLVLAGLLGTLAGAGVFTFIYGQGHSYLSDDPAACINCHIMQPQHDEWLKSSHSAVATCNDCHLPAEFFSRWTAKADNGFFHSWAFTFENFHEPIQIKVRNLRILQDNCIRCHQTMVHQMLIEPATGEAVSCMHCHVSVGHGARTAGQPRRFPTEWRFPHE